MTLIIIRGKRKFVQNVKIGEFVAYMKLFLLGNVF